MEYRYHTPWYRDGLVWSVMACILFGVLIGIILGQFITL